MNTKHKKFIFVYDSVTSKTMLSGLFLQIFIRNLRDQNWSIAIMGLFFSVVLYKWATEKSYEIEYEIFYKRNKFNRSLLSLMGYSIAIYVLSGISLGIIIDNFGISLWGFLIAFSAFLVVTFIQNSICEDVTKKISYNYRIGKCVNPDT
jgi:hypothetical protein